MAVYRLILSLVIVLSEAGTALAQDVDPIGALLDQVPVASAPPLATETWRPAPVFASPKPRAITSGTPVKIDEIGKTPDGPLSASDLSYESRLRSAFQSAQGTQGPLDGRWVIRSGEISLYLLQLVDRGALEGAWRDPRRPAASGASGFIDAIIRNGEQLIVDFTATQGGGPISLSLRLLPNGQITGDLTEYGVRSNVTMVRQ